LVGNRYGKRYDEAWTTADYTSASTFNNNDQLTTETTIGAGARLTVYLCDPPAAQTGDGAEAAPVFGQGVQRPPV
jgi:hypothetical protein